MRGGIVEVLMNRVDEKSDGDDDTDCGVAEETGRVPLDGLSFRVGKDGHGNGRRALGWGRKLNRAQRNRVPYICFPLVELEAGPQQTRFDR